MENFEGLEEIIRCEHGPRHDYHHAYACGESVDQRLGDLWWEFHDHEGTTQETQFWPLPTVRSGYLEQMLYLLLGSPDPDEFGEKEEEKGDEKEDEENEEKGEGKQ